MTIIQPSVCFNTSSFHESKAIAFLVESLPSAVFPAHFDLLCCQTDEDVFFHFALIQAVIDTVLSQCCMGFTAVRPLLYIKIILSLTEQLDCVQKATFMYEYMMRTNDLLSDPCSSKETSSKLIGYIIMKKSYRSVTKVRPCCQRINLRSNYNQAETL